MTDDINWSQEREVFYAKNSGEYYVKVFGGYMLDTDYIEGGQTILPFNMEPVESIGKFTNTQIQSGDYVKDEDD